MKSMRKKGCLVLALLLGQAAVRAQETPDHNQKIKEQTMSVAQKNKEVISRLYDECLNQKNMNLAALLVAGSFTGPKGEKGPEAFEAPLKLLLQAFPDAHWEVEYMVAEGDKVMVKQRLQGTHTGTFQGIAPTGKTVSNEGVATYELKDGKVIAAQPLTDRFGFLQQLGVIPADLNTLIAGRSRKGEVQFIDRFVIPPAAKAEFYERMAINRAFIKKLPGFIGDVAYTYTDAQDNLVCITVARWESKAALDKAKEQVQAAYRQEGFDPAAMFQRLHIVADRGVYTELDAQ